MKKLKSFLLSRWALFVCGLLCYFAFAPYFMFPIMWFSLALLSIKNERSGHKASFANAFCLGAGLGITGMNWLAHAMVLGDGYYAWLVPLIWIGFALFFGLYYGVTAWFASFAKPGVSRWFAFAGWFCVIEWVRGWAFSGFPWNVIGNVWNAYLPIFQIVSVVGVYGLGFLSVLLFTTPNFGRKLKPTLWAVVALGIVYALGAWRLYEAPKDSVWGVKLRLVQPNIPCTLKWDPREAQNNINKLIRLSRTNNDEITHIIWPESAISFLLNYHEQQRLQLMAAMRQGSVLITGAMRAANTQDQSVANSLFVLDDLTNIHAFYDKAHLVPFGEYTPLKGILPLDKFVPFDSDIVAGPGPKTIPIEKAPPASPMVCYEAIFPGEVVDEAHRPDWLIHVTNDGWYGMSAGPYHHFAMAQTRAVEEGLPLARSANTGISGVVDAYGRIWDKMDLGKEGVVDVALPKPAPPTIFSRYGNKLALILAGIFILISMIRKKSA
ncbi:MAG: apolipoprotein N-acyltransferase [Alphaproteobacteria bacterium]|nr:apolipoprotein N-acyltransferase [Alphaproteobacteria bacterium]